MKTKHQRVKDLINSKLVPDYPKGEVTEAWDKYLNQVANEICEILKVEITEGEKEEPVSEEELDAAKWVFKKKSKITEEEIEKLNPYDTILSPVFWNIWRTAAKTIIQKLQEE